MTEKDILWESDCERLWVGKTPFGFTLFKVGLTHSEGFLTFGKLADAIENGIEFATKDDSYIEKFIF